MKVLILTNYANGLYLFRKELLEMLRKDNYDVVVSVPLDENCKKISELGCRMIETSLERRGNNPIRDFKLFQSYCKMLEEEKPDYVLTYTIKPNIYGGIACRIKRVSYICNITGLGTAIESNSLLSTILILLYRIAVKKAKRVYFQNENNKSFMNSKGVACHNFDLLPGSGVNLTEHPFVDYPSEEDGIVFLAVIRIMKDKGIEEYLQTAEKVKQKYQRVKFWLVGEYEEDTRNHYEPIIQDYVNRHVIKYFGHIDNVKDIMAKSHIIVHPSYHEGLSNVLLEAAACGRPVLASDISGCRETFVNEKSGYSFPIKRSDMIVSSVDKILSLSTEQRREMGMIGRKWVENHFNRELILQKYRNELI